MATNSIIANLNAETAISEITLLLNEPKHKGKTFILLEGDDDIKLFSKLLHDKTTLIRSYGSNTAIDNILSRYFLRKKNVIGIRDKDYQMEKACNKVFYCDFCCAELMIFSSDESIQSIKCELYSGSYSATNLRLEILEALRFLSCARKASSLNSWKIKFDGIKAGKFYDKARTTMNSAIMDEINKQNPDNIIDQSRNRVINDMILNHQNLNDLLNITNGHDFVNLFCEICRKNEKNTSIDKCASVLRASFTKHEFLSTALYADLKTYEKQNQLSIVV